jgi:hypothetical protein
MIAAHVVFGTWGMYRFLRLKGLSESGSILGGLSFGLMPKLAAHFGAGHVSLIYAISWTPWLFYSLERDKKGVNTGVIAGMIFLADPRWSIYAGVFWLSYVIAHRQKAKEKGVSYFARAAILAFMISSPLLIPMVEYVQYTSRTALAAGDILYGSLPVSNLIGAIIPGSGGNSEWFFYSGGSLLALSVTQIVNREYRNRIKFWITWLGISLILALGTWGIEAEWISAIPIFNLLRVPARSLFLIGFCLAVIGAIAFDNLLGEDVKSPGNRTIAFGIFIFGMMLLGGILILTKAQPLMIAWGFLAFMLIGGILLKIQYDPSTKYLGWIMLAILVIDLLGAGITAYDVQSKETWKFAKDLSILNDDDGIFRIYSPSYSVGQHLAAEYGLELADGVDPMHLATYANFMAEASGVDQSGYSVTIPPFKSGNPSLDNIDAIPDSKLLGLLNVKYIVSKFEIDSMGLKLIQDQNDLYIYGNENVRPRAWIEASGQNDNVPASVEITSRNPNNIHLVANGPGTLVISEIYYPGWQVTVDGKRDEIDLSNEILSSVHLDEGEHIIEYRFRPLSVYVGLMISILGWMIATYITIRK